MKRHFKTLMMVMVSIAMVLCVSCKKDHNEPVGNCADNLSDSDGSIEGHEYVDLGLPSGVLWGTCNVGAKSPEEYGDYFAWGETKTKTTYEWSSYVWCKGSSNTLTKYNTNSNNGTVDKKTILDPEDDAAHVNWGGSWHMPTNKDMQELWDKCTWIWTTDYGNYGYRVTGPNGKSIFLPAAGYRFGIILNNKCLHGFYWSSSLYPTISNNAYSIYFHSDNVIPQGIYPRFRGYTVRPVWSK